MGVLAKLQSDNSRTRDGPARTSLNNPVEYYSNNKFDKTNNQTLLVHATCSAYLHSKILFTSSFRSIAFYFLHHFTCLRSLVEFLSFCTGSGTSRKSMSRISCLNFKQLWARSWLKTWTTPWLCYWAKLKRPNHCVKLMSVLKRRTETILRTKPPLICSCMN